MLLRNRKLNQYPTRSDADQPAPRFTGVGWMLFLHADSAV
jgi:hypothetical protein